MKARREREQAVLVHGNNGGEPWLQNEAISTFPAEKAKPATIDPVPGTADSRRLCEEISALSGGVCFLGFSRGKDSIAALVWLKRFFTRIIPFHCCGVPHLSFVDESLKYYEDLFGCEILRFIEGDVMRAIGDLHFQPPTAEAEINDMDLWLYDKLDIVELLRRELDLPDAWCAWGILTNDNMFRRMYCAKRFRNENRKSFYPIYDWTRRQVIETLVAERILLPKDYLVKNRTLSAMPQYRDLKGIEEKYPADMQRIEDVFPFIRAEMARQEFRAARLAKGKNDA